MALFKRRTPKDSTVTHFCERIKRRSRGTKKSWQTDVNRMRAAAALLPVRYVEEIAPRHIAAVLDAKEAEDVSPTTVNAVREILCRFCNWQLMENDVEFDRTGRENPVLRIPRHKQSDVEITFLEPDEFDALLEVLDPEPQMRAVAAMMGFAGPRRGAVVWLTVDDVDLENLVIRIRKKTIDGEHWQPKTGKARVIPISARLAQELARWTRPDVDCPWHFPSPMGCRWDEDNLSKRLRRLQRAAGTSWGALDLRHTFGTMLARRGVSLYKISALLGNSPEVCRKHYAHLMPEELRDEVEFAELLPDAEETSSSPADAPDPPVEQDPPQESDRPGDPDETGPMPDTQAPVAGDDGQPAEPRAATDEPDGHADATGEDEAGKAHGDQDADHAEPRHETMLDAFRRALLGDADGTTDK